MDRGIEYVCFKDDDEEDEEAEEDEDEIDAVFSILVSCLIVGGYCSFRIDCD
jgi:hypothetical protein